MKARLLVEAHGQRTLAIVFDTGDDVIEGLRSCAREHHIAAASFTAIGAFRSVVLGYFDVERREYRPIPIDEQVEVLSLIGNIATDAQAPQVHAHVVVGKADGTAHGGHLLNGTVRPTLEVVLVEQPAHLRRVSDARTGLALIDLDAL
jgi:predicted DNA-binding protein with PD1-like motif